MLKQLINPFVNAIILVVVYVLYGLIQLDIPRLLNLIIELSIGLIITLAFLHITGRFNIIAFAKNKLKK